MRFFLCPIQYVVEVPALRLRSQDMSKLTMERHAQEQKYAASPRLMRLKEVLQVIPVGRSTWWLWVSQGKAPAPIKLGERVTCWHSADIEAFVDGMGGRHEG